METRRMTIPQALAYLSKTGCCQGCLENIIQAQKEGVRNVTLRRDILTPGIWHIQLPNTRKPLTDQKVEE